MGIWSRSQNTSMLESSLTLTSVSRIRATLISAVMLCGLGVAHANPSLVKVEYLPRQDLLCALLPGASIKEEWKVELLARQAEFETLWNAQGPRLMEAAETITGKRFPPEQIEAQLTLCNTPSESFAATGRVSINMRYALRSFTSTPVPMRYKVDTLFHELLHVFLFKNPIQNSRLLEENASEPERVRNHLHLLALQKAVLLKLNEPDALKDVIAIDSQLPGGYYKRAWAIVNATDDAYLGYVAEASR